jgi:hypothetical protein
MYEVIWNKENFPKEWRSATVIPILKPIPTNISDEPPVQGPRKDRKEKTGIHPGRKKPTLKATVRLQKKIDPPPTF